MTDEKWKVVRKVGDQFRTLFEGTEADVRAHVENNFPRAHVEPNNNYGDEGPKPDVLVKAPDGGEHSFNGEWKDHNAADAADVPTEPVEPVETEVE